VAQDLLAEFSGIRRASSRGRNATGQSRAGAGESHERGDPYPALHSGFLRDDPKSPALNMYATLAAGLVAGRLHSGWVCGVNPYEHIRVYSDTARMR